MELTTLSNDITVVFLSVANFPDDVPSTYVRLHAQLPEEDGRRYFGISHADQHGAIQYKAAAEVLAGEKFDSAELEQFVIRKGPFASKYIVNHFQDSQCIGLAFKELLGHPDLDPVGYCLEVYKNYTDLDVHCMVRLLTIDHSLNSEA